jgi:hypothetical protein
MHVCPLGISLGLSILYPITVSLSLSLSLSPSLSSLLSRTSRSSVFNLARVCAASIPRVSDNVRDSASTKPRNLSHLRMTYRSRQCMKVVSESGKGRSITYGECLRRAQQLRSGLMSKLLLSPGKRAGVLSPAGPDRLVFQVGQTNDTNRGKPSVIMAG